MPVSAGSVSVSAPHPRRAARRPRKPRLRRIKVARVERLATLKAQGGLSEEEFETAKGEVLGPVVARVAWSTIGRVGRRLSIGVVGISTEFPPHPATEAALRHSAEGLGVEPDVRWLATELLAEADPRCRRRCPVVCPGSPYKSLEGALRAIRFAREEDVPFLGTCGGFQHVVLEYARNVLGFEDAQHAEYDPYASGLFVTELSCSLAGQKMEVRLAEGSRQRVLRTDRTAEEYYCNFGLNPEHQRLLHDGGLPVPGTDQDGEARVLELPERRFFIATLFVPTQLIARLPTSTDHRLPASGHTARRSSRGPAELDAVRLIPARPRMWCSNIRVFRNSKG